MTPLILLLALLIMPAPLPGVNSEQQGGWRTYKGAWFEIRYPGSFSVHPSMPSSSASGYDSVFFTSPDDTIAFYVFSPQWNGTPGDIEIDPANEILISHKVERRSGKTVRRVSIRARDNKYFRAFEDTEDHTTNTRRVFGITYRDQNAYNRYRQAYLLFKSSLRQFAD